MNLCTGSIRAIGTGELDRGEYNQPRWTSSAPGVLLIKREVFSQVGWYDERFDPYGWEDVEALVAGREGGIQDTLRSTGCHSPSRRKEKPG